MCVCIYIYIYIYKVIFNPRYIAFPSPSAAPPHGCQARAAARSSARGGGRWHCVATPAVRVAVRAAVRAVIRVIASRRPGAQPCRGAPPFPQRVACGEIPRRQARAAAGPRRRADGAALLPRGVEALRCPLATRTLRADLSPHTASHVTSESPVVRARPAAARPSPRRLNPLSESPSESLSE